MENLSQADILDIARNEGFSISEITYGMNGYPKGLGNYAVTGFDNFEQAQKFAQENNCEINLFEKRDGHQFFITKGIMTRSLTSDDYLKDLGDNYSEASNDYEHEADLIKEAILNLDFEQAEAILKQIKEIQEEIESADEDEIVILTYGKYFETVKKEMMQYHEDVTLYVIGVLVSYNKD